ncbi:PEP-CTERM sorting domain-containing protein [Roseofilum sp. BLCC_M91]|uniref:PEP-CTERM sorting domain-containing protein n=1 Tax=Roseofilum halophilum BLCC-M91 TaxID=3022259 RepID=A0ABT7BT45_9CYAN|nr:PEP-CTERM sorting domain-containing protein [Roseofilum halophilum]MDJ1181478.1 PEP-CTERM sorting domain-containing protein [Roseofilum halophilum BLCC-M91]
MKLFSHHLSLLYVNALGSIVGALALIMAIAPSAFAAKFADFVFVVDESGSMGGEHSWIGQTIGDLEAALQAKGVGTKSQQNRYGLVGFGNRWSSSRLGHSIPVGGGLFGSATEFANATGSLVTNGTFEDGYSAIHYALNNYSFRQGAAVNFVLVTDEDRDNGNSALNFDNTLNALDDKNALLNVVVNHRMTGNNGQQAIGSDRDGNTFFADGQGGFSTVENGLKTPELPNPPLPPKSPLKPYPPRPPYPRPPYRGWGSHHYSDNTKRDYVDLAWATGNSLIGGAAWDLNLLRSGGTTAQSFSAAFVDIKATEALKQTQIPEPSATLGLLGLAAFGAAQSLRRKSV